MALTDVLKNDVELEVKIKWIEQYDYDLYQYIKSVFNNKHFSRIILSIKPSLNQLNVSFVNLTHDKSMFLESKSLDHLSWSLEQGILEALNHNHNPLVVSS